MHHSPQGGDGADLLADVLLDLFEEVGRGDGGGGVCGGGDGNEGEGEVAFEGVGDADDAAFGNGRVGGDGLFDGAWGGGCINSCSFVVWSKGKEGRRTSTEAVGGNVDDVV